MTKDEYKFKNKGMNDFCETTKEQIAKTLTLTKDDIVCKGFCIYFLSKPDGVLIKENIVLKGFELDDYGE